MEIELCSACERGDTVRLIGIPASLRDVEDLNTSALFEKCLGRTFVVDGLEQSEGLPYPLVRLDVGDVLGEITVLDSYSP